MKVRALEQTQFLLKAKECEVTNLEHQVQKLTAEAAIQRQTAKELQQVREELTQLRTENEESRSAQARKEQITHLKDDSGVDQPSKRPIDRTERHALAMGAAEQILNDLQHELEVTKREKEELHHQLQQGTALNRDVGLPPSYIHPKTEIYPKMLEHTAPLNSVMQYYQVYRVIDLMANDLPMLKRGITLKLTQFKDLWDQASPRAKDTLAFMWAVGDLKLPLGIIEIVTGSPPFYIRRYMLRSIAFLTQHKAIQARKHNTNQPLPTLRPYTHSQKLEITKLQHMNKTLFQQAIETLKKEDTMICFEAVRRHQWLTEHYPEQSIQVTLPQLKAYVTQTQEEQQISVTKNHFGTINNGTILRLQAPDLPETFRHDNFEA
jgi:hypothetical protein